MVFTIEKQLRNILAVIEGGLDMHNLELAVQGVNRASELVKNVEVQHGKTSN